MQKISVLEVKLKKKNKIFENLNPDFGYYYTYDREITSKKSRYQKIKLIQTREFGKVLLLDGITQLGEKAEYCYHEPMVHPGMLTHPSPRDVLVIGGGDGGCSREVLKHPSVKNLTHVDLDGDVIEFSRKHLPSLNGGAFASKKNNIIVGDGRKYVFETKDKYDVVIMDMTDPFGPSRMLYTREFFRAIKKTLRNRDGVFTMHAESPVSRPRTYRSILKTLGSVFKKVRPMYIYIQMYSMYWSVAVSSDKTDIASLTPAVADRRLKSRKIKGLQVINGESLRAMQIEFPYISAIRKKKAKLITDRDPEFEDEIKAL